MKIKSILGLAIALTFLLAPHAQTIAQEKSDKQVFLVVEDMPQFQGKDIKHFRNWVMTQVKYPKEALKNGISGKVFAEFVIDRDGQVTDVKIKKGVDKLLDDEVVRVIKSSPKWTPGKQRGKSVKVQFTFPINFVLQ